MYKVYKKQTKRTGVGIFAKKNLKKGEIIFIVKGKLISFIVKNKKDALFGDRWLSISKNRWINPREGGPWYFINHSCNPNAGIKGKVSIVAMRNIKKGEEITIDYSITEAEKLWHMKCNCGNKNCRKKIKSIQFLPEKIYIKYLPFIPKYIQKERKLHLNK